LLGAAFADWIQCVVFARFDPGENGVRNGMKILETERLLLRQLTPKDAPFIFELVNEPAWLQFIGDKGVRNLEDARDYISRGPMAMYERFGYGLYLTELRDSGVSIGISGLVRRDALSDADIGFAFLAKFRARGYGYESASAVLEHARNKLGLKRVLAITSPDNHSSIKLLERIGLAFEHMIRMSENASETKLFAVNYD
jgi:ribosomal-protein-alanine N-acetyltransferase